MPFLRGERTGVPHETLYWKIKSSVPHRRNKWKLVRLAPEWKPQLYHLFDDIGETRDLAGARPEIVEQLQAAWETWNRPMPPPARAVPAGMK